MARNVETIHQDILTNIANNATLTPLNSTSKTAIYRLFAYIVAYAIHLHEVIFDTHKQEVETLIANQKSGTLPWYRYMALQFQYGFDLLNNPFELFTDSDQFNNTNATPEQIDASKIIKYAAVNETEAESRVIIKIAGEVGNALAPITPPQRAAFEAYLNEIRYAGVKLTVINYLPDLLFLNLQIQRDPLVLDANGMSILNGNYPVNDAITAYMKLLPFNGEFVIFDFLKYIEANAEGVITPTALNIESSFIDPLTGNYAAPVSIAIKTIPFSGYFKVDNFNTISYVV